MSSTITTLRPFNLNEGYVPLDPGDNTKEQRVTNLFNRFMTFIRELPFFDEALVNNPTYSSGDHFYRWDFPLSNGAIISFYFNEGSFQSPLYFYISFRYQASNNFDQTMYSTYNSFFTESSLGSAWRYDVLNGFKLTTVENDNANGFWMNYSTYSSSFYILKAINVNDPNIIEYHPAFFIYDYRGQYGPDYNTFIPSPGSTFSVGGKAILLNDYVIVDKANPSRYDDGYSNSYNMRQFVNNEWIYPALYLLEGGITPVYNTRNKIKYANDDYLFLSNRFLLKL